MSKFRILLVVLLAQSAFSQQQSVRPSIQGSVVSVSSEKPIAGAVVELTVVEDDKVVTRTVTTRDDGEFIFRNLTPGPGYQIVVSGPGIQPTAYGQRSSQDPWTPIALAIGEQRTDLKITVQSLTGIRGRVQDKQGAPVIGANVVAMRPTYVDGRKIVESFAYTVTDLRGDYRFSALPIGPYYIRVMAPNPGIPEMSMSSPALLDQSEAGRTLLKNEPEGYPVVYFPGSKLESAKAVQIRDGSIAENIDVRVARVRTGRLRGTVIHNANRATVTSARIFLVPQGSAVDSNWTRTLEFRAGQFDLRGVLPGAYFLTALVAESDKRLWGRIPVEIKEAETKTIEITVSPGIAIEGRIGLEDAGNPDTDLSMLSVHLIPDMTTPVDASLVGLQVNLPSAAAVSSANGAFTFREVVPWDYRVLVAWGGRKSGAYVKSAQVGNKDALLDGLHPDGTGTAPLEIMLGTNTGGLDGRVTEKGDNVALARVVLVPDARRRYDLYAAMTTTSTGRFQFQGLAPGDYKLFAWHNVPDGAWLDPDFLEADEDKGTKVHIAENSAEYIEVPVLR